ncbi:glutamate 5-kinase [Paraglaciecola polaris]|uniref:Glutamate 5-kinase n=1 Tax=Paraglaciecola polaris LMG 21857 TaxID=1129793 RepID=K6ZQR4_9ALTE|nr:glutamate 5-kinase [Paraglaciecola polaris]GAC31203.1 glutamate 5-kinase [Paraglaciecola polaris LMG 21857]|tara:strand:- start:4441 stop:5538 length:1098 start_codon:yes stop_codon:yes gene_type:complete
MSQFAWQRAVIKVGSALIAPDGNACSSQFLLPIAQFICASRAQGKEVILVSSGSVAAGRSKIAYKHFPSIAEKQAMAAVGQTQMMANWAQLFDFDCAQILLTSDDLHNRTRYVNIKNTLRELLRNHALPIVNENDTVVINELKVGDNDNLAAYTALVAQADTLIICSDIDGLYDADPRKNPHARFIPKVHEINQQIHDLAGGAGTSVGTGGMRTKIQAAEKCAKSGIQTLIVNGRNADVFAQLSQGKQPGTLFVPSKNRDGARTQWLRHTLRSKGTLVIDVGARQALMHKGASLLPSGITSVLGSFKPGEAVDIRCKDQIIAKGLSLYSNSELVKIKGQQSDKIDTLLGYSSGEVVIHRDDMVLL